MSMLSAELVSVEIGLFFFALFVRRTNVAVTRASAASADFVAFASGASATASATACDATAPAGPSTTASGVAVACGDSIFSIYRVVST